MPMYASTSRKLEILNKVQAPAEDLSTTEKATRNGNTAHPGLSLVFLLPLLVVHI